jgi:iron complex transport system substrate-binding protein
VKNPTSAVGAPAFARAPVARTPVHGKRWRAPAAVLAACALTALTACGSSGSSQSSAQPSGSAPATTTSPAPATAGQATFPLTIKTPGGVVTIKSRPARIVSLSATATEDLFAVGAGKQVIAVDLSSNYPPGVPKTSLNEITPNIEAIAGYNPSLVVTAQDANGLMAGMKKLGVPVLIEPPATSIDGAYAQIEQIGQASGHPDGAQAVVAGMKSQVTADLAKAGTTHSDLSYYWELSANPYYSATSQTFIGQVVSMFGLKNVADAAAKAADGGYPQITPEYILAARPQIIFLADNQPGDGGQTPAVVAARPGWSAIPAVKNHQVIGLNDDVASRWGPRLPQLIAEIAAAVESASKS